MPKDSPPTPTRSVCGRSRDAGARRADQPRDDLRSLDGYHSPQVDVRIRLNTNESPYAPPDDFVASYTDALRDVAWHRYPDRAARELRRALGSSLGPTDGATALRERQQRDPADAPAHLRRAGRRAVIFEPTYALHAHIAEITNTEIVTGERRADFTVDPDAAVALVPRHPSVVGVPLQPEQPDRHRRAARDGRATARGRGRHRRAARRRRGLRRVRTVERARARRPTSSPLVVVRTYSKVWSLAAVRLGFAVAPAWVIDELDKVLLPYALSVPTQLAGHHRARLPHRDGEARGRAGGGARPPLRRARRRCPAFRSCPSGANFLLVRVNGDAHDLWRRLLERGVLVRDFSSRPGVEGCFRITVGTPDENDEFLAAISAALPEVVR